MRFIGVLGRGIRCCSPKAKWEGLAHSCWLPALPRSGQYFLSACLPSSLPCCDPPPRTAVPSSYTPLFSGVESATASSPRTFACPELSLFLTLSPTSGSREPLSRPALSMGTDVIPPHHLYHENHSKSGSLMVQCLEPCKFFLNISEWLHCLIPWAFTLSTGA